MSTRAAWRLEEMGFTSVSDYVTGKADWLAAGLPTEGTKAGTERMKDVMVPVETCPPDDIRDGAVVVNAEGVVLGLVQDGAVDPAPKTVRADEDMEPLAERMHEAGRDTVLVTTPDARLLGRVHLDAIDAALARRHP